MTDTARRWLIGIIAAVLLVLFLWWSADYVYDLGRADARAESSWPTRLTNCSEIRHRDCAE